MKKYHIDLNSKQPTPLNSLDVKNSLIFSILYSKKSTDSCRVILPNLNQIILGGKPFMVCSS